MPTNVTAPFIFSALVAISLLAGCSRGPMPPTQANADALSKIIQAAGREITMKETQEGSESDEARKRNTRKLFVAPFARAGFNLDATLADYAVRLRDGNFTQDEAPVVMGIVMLYKDTAADLARWGSIRSETRGLVVEGVK